MITLENEHLTVKINTFGAEIASVIDRQTSYEFMWQADPEFWARQAPVLFPIVGRLKDNQFKYEEHLYEMTQHGFARDSVFEVVESTEQMALFKLTSSDETKRVYPFDFELYIQYKLSQKSVVTKYKVVNTADADAMYYAIGGHPAFNVSQKMTEEGELEFDQVSFQIQPETPVRYFPLSEGGLIKNQEMQEVSFGEVEVTHDTFEDDALVFEMGESKTIVLKDKANHVEIRMQTANLPYLGIWSPYPKRGSFVCIEPWAGIADAEDTDGEFVDKIGINMLAPLEEKVHEYHTTFIKE